MSEQAKQPRQLWRVVAPHFVAGLVTDGDVVVSAPPILAWAKGKTRAVLRRYFARKGWTVTRIEELPNVIGAKP